MAGLTGEKTTELIVVSIEGDLIAILEKSGADIAQQIVEDHPIFILQL